MKRSIKHWNIFGSGLQFGPEARNTIASFVRHGPNG